MEYRSPSQNTTCVFWKGGGRITFTVMLPLEGFTFPHLPGASPLQISFRLCPHAPSTCSGSSTSALTRKTRLVVLQVKWKGSQEESGTSSHSSKAAKIVYRNCTGSRTKQGNKSAPGLQLLLHKLLAQSRTLQSPALLSHGIQCGARWIPDCLTNGNHVED